MNILFVCTGNTCRSPIAERILRSIADEKGLKINVKAAGIVAFNGAAAADNAIKAMEKIKINIRDHTSTNLSEELIMDSNLLEDTINIFIITGNGMIV